MRFLACLGYAALLLLGACAQQAPELRLGVSPWPGNAPFIQAGDEGRLGAGVRVVEFSSETATLQAFRNGALEAAILTLDETLLLAAEGLRLRVAALTDISAGAGKIMARPAVKGLKDLRGRRVAVESSAVGAFILAHALREAGLALADIEMVALLPHEQAREYAAGRIDAAVGHEPYSTRLERLGARAVRLRYGARR
jgi:NitT/TauT family transport system substrate-binding protein